MPDFNITVIDHAVVVLYLVVTVAVGLSLLATNQSGASYVGLAGSGYDNGIAIFNYEWMGAMFFIFFLFFFLPFYYRRARVFTTPEFLESRFDRRSRVAFSVFLLIAAIFVDIGSALYGGGIVISVLFPGVPLWTIIVGLALVAGIYTITGGLAAVVLTDSIQAVMFLVGGLAIAVAIFTQVGSIEARLSL